MFFSNMIRIEQLAQVHIGQFFFPKKWRIMCSDSYDSIDGPMIYMHIGM